MVLTDVDGDFAAVVEVTAEFSPSLTPPEDLQGNTVSATVQGAGLLCTKTRTISSGSKDLRVNLGSIQPSYKVLLEVVKKETGRESEDIRAGKWPPVFDHVCARQGARSLSTDLAAAWP